MKNQEIIQRINELADFTIIAEGFEMKVVKAFLMFCPYFEAMLSSCFAESV